MRRDWLLPGLLAGACALAGSPAGAQVAGGGTAAEPNQPGPRWPAQSGVAPSVEHLLGDPGGVRTGLENLGIYLLVDATTEFAANVSGGTRQGATFANQIGL